MYVSGFISSFSLCPRENSAVGLRARLLAPRGECCLRSAQSRSSRWPHCAYCRQVKQGFPRLCLPSLVILAGQVGTHHTGRAAAAEASRQHRTSTRNRSERLATDLSFARLRRSVARVAVLSFGVAVSCPVDPSASRCLPVALPALVVVHHEVHQPSATENGGAALLAI